VVALAAALAHAAAAQSVHEQGEVNVDVDDRVHFGELVELLCLEEVAGESVEEVAIGAVGFGQTAFHDLAGDLVGDELSLVGVGLREKPELGAALDVVAEDIARGDVRKSEFLGNARSLRSLAGARRSQKNDVHSCLTPYFFCSPLPFRGEEAIG